MYEIKEITLKNKNTEKKRLIIEFNDPEMAILGEFLMADAGMLDYRVLDQINFVLAGSSTVEKFSGNRTSLTIERTDTKIEDLFESLFDDFNPFEVVEMNTVKLRDLILTWKEKKDVFDRENK